MTDTLAPIASTASTATEAEPLRVHEADGYPELLRDMAVIVERKLSEAGLETARAAAIAMQVIEEVREHFGGQMLYMPKGQQWERRRVWQAMWLAFDGRNHAWLADKFGMNVVGVYRVLAIMRAEHRKRVQPDMFQAAAVEDGGCAGTAGAPLERIAGRGAETEGR